jgi:hypothetical protein
MTVDEWVEQWFERTYCNVLVALAGEWEALSTAAADHGDGVLGQCRQKHAQGYSAAGMTASDMWTAYGFLAGKSADLALLEGVRAAPPTDQPYTDRLVVLFRTRVAVTVTIERMYWLYERLVDLGTAGQPMPTAEADVYAAWLEDGGIAADEVYAAAADVGVPITYGASRP